MCAQLPMLRHHMLQIPVMLAQRTVSIRFPCIRSQTESAAAIAVRTAVSIGLEIATEPCVPGKLWHIQAPALSCAPFQDTQIGDDSVHLFGRLVRTQIPHGLGECIGTSVDDHVNRPRVILRERCCDLIRARARLTVTHVTHTIVLLPGADDAAKVCRLMPAVGMQLQVVQNLVITVKQLMEEFRTGLSRRYLPVTAIRPSRWNILEHISMCTICCSSSGSLSMSAQINSRAPSYLRESYCRILYSTVSAAIQELWMKMYKRNAVRDRQKYPRECCQLASDIRITSAYDHEQRYAVERLEV